MRKLSPLTTNSRLRKKCKKRKEKNNNKTLLSVTRGYLRKIKSSWRNCNSKLGFSSRRYRPGTDTHLGIVTSIDTWIDTPVIFTQSGRKVLCHRQSCGWRPCCRTPPDMQQPCVDGVGAASWLAYGGDGGAQLILIKMWNLSFFF